MQRLTVRLAVILLAAGCGGSFTTQPSTSTTPPTTSLGESQADLTTTTMESTDVASAAIQIGDEEMLPFAATRFPFALRGRPEIGNVLRALAIDVRLCANHETVMPTTKMSSCNAIGVNGKYRGGATITFNQCMLPWGGSLDGTVVIDVTKELAAGQMCSPRAMIDVTHAVTLTQLVHVRGDGVTVEFPSAMAQSKSTRAVGHPPTSLNLDMSGERKVTQKDGTVSLDHKFNETATVTFMAASAMAPPSIVINAMATIEHLVAMFTFTLTVDNLTRSADCCLPVSGSVKVERTGSVMDSHETTFGPKCGQETVDGKMVSIRECR